MSTASASRVDGDTARANYNLGASDLRTFSGGMARRLEIGRSMLHTPAVFFLDEPTVGLDPQTRALM